jgi:hypothetical protein
VGQSRRQTTCGFLDDLMHTRWSPGKRCRSRAFLIRMPSPNALISEIDPVQEFGSVLIWIFFRYAVALRVLRIQSETVCLLAFALDSIARSSSGVTRIRKVPTFAAPFGSGGRPAFLGFGLWLILSKLLYD